MADADKNLFGEVVADKAPTLIVAQPVAATIYLPATWYARGKRWKIQNSFEYIAREEAVERAEKICNSVQGHTHYAILEVKFPGVNPK